MTVYNVILAIVAVGVCCIALAAVLPDVLITWYGTDTTGMAFGESPDKVGVLSWNMMPFFGVVIIGLMFVIGVKNAL